MKNFNKVFNIGLNKSGTTSLTKALNLLGIKSVHYCLHKEKISEIISYNKKNNKKLMAGLEQFRGFSDFSGQLLYKQLDQQYPNSKFILTVRDFDDWIRSQENHQKKKEEKGRERKKINKKRKEEHRKQIIANVTQFFKNRPDDLLIIDIPKGDGWNKLCPFLGIKIPNTPFPHINKTKKNKKKTTNDINKIINRILGLIGIFLNKYFPKIYLLLKRKK